MVQDKGLNQINILNASLDKVHEIPRQSLMDNWGHSHKIRSRVEKIRVGAFVKMRTIFCNQQLNMDL